MPFGHRRSKGSQPYGAEGQGPAPRAQGARSAFSPLASTQGQDRPRPPANGCCHTRLRHPAGAATSLTASATCAPLPPGSSPRDIPCLQPDTGPATRTRFPGRRWGSWGSRSPRRSAGEGPHRAMLGTCALMAGARGGHRALLSGETASGTSGQVPGTSLRASAPAPGPQPRSRGRIKQPPPNLLSRPLSWRKGGPHSPCQEPLGAQHCPPHMTSRR